MKYYKDTITNEIYAYESDGSQDNFIKDGLVLISNNEAETIRASNEKNLAQNNLIDSTNVISVADLTKSIQDQQIIIEELKAKVNALEKS